MCPLLPTFVQESTVRGIDVLVSVSVAHFGAIARDDRESHHPEGCSLPFFPRHILPGGDLPNILKGTAVPAYDLDLAQLVPDRDSFSTVHRSILKASLRLRGLLCCSSSNCTPLMRRDFLVLSRGAMREPV